VLAAFNLLFRGASMSTTPVTTPEGQRETSAISRMVGVIVSPKKTFADIARRPTWLAPFLILCVLSVAAGALVGQKTDWRSFFEHQNSKNANFDRMPQDQKDRIQEGQMKYAPKLAFAIGLLGTIFIIFLLTLLYWGAFNLFTGAGLGFKTAFSIVTHACVVLIISSVLAIVILLIKAQGDVDPEHVLASSVSAFLPDTAPRWLEQLGQSLELFWIWMLALIAIGFSAANPKKVKPAGAFLTVFGIWAVWVVAKVAWAMF
jgi:hypothetical protein